MAFDIAKHPELARPEGPVVIVIMDGVGIGSGDEDDAVALARTPTLDGLRAHHPHCPLRAHGTAVGLPSDGDMGNSEVGHNAMGAGRVFAQGAKLVNGAIETGDLFRGQVWQSILERSRAGGALHLIGLLSDGNVHSHMDHLFALIRAAADQGIERLFVHPLLDGRDVPESSALVYVEALETNLGEMSKPGAGDKPRTYRIASGGGRMVVTMDRYEADWTIVERGYNAHVHGQGRPFGSATEAIETYRAEDPDLIDQFMSEFVITDDNGPVGTIAHGDSVVYFNFRGDRALEISRAFEEGEDFDKFDRGARPEVLYAGMMQYDGDLMIPQHYLVKPPAIERTLGEYLARNGVAQFACAETQKYGHVTYFWNGNRSGKFDEELETYVEVRSDRVPFEQRPWMKAAQVTDAVVEAVGSGRYPLIRVNYANGDMVGHTGDREATIGAVQTVDLCLTRLLKAVRRAKGVALITADHGNADQMYEKDKKTGAIKRDDQGRPQSKTSHTLNPVECLLVDYSQLDRQLSLNQDPAAGLSNVAATVLELLGYTPPEGFDASLLSRSCAETINPVVP
jgi:2,3-bisphosphoglycerate-independent phosphoglycerate mutase